MSSIAPYPSGSSIDLYRAAVFPSSQFATDRLVEDILRAFSVRVSSPVWVNDPHDGPLDYGSTSHYTINEDQIDLYTGNPLFQTLDSDQWVKLFEAGYLDADRSVHTNRQYSQLLLEALVKIPSFQQVPIHRLETCFLQQVPARVLMKTNRFQELSGACLGRALLHREERGELDQIPEITSHPNFEHVPEDIWLRLEKHIGRSPGFFLALAEHLPSRVNRMPPDFLCSLFVNASPDMRDHEACLAPKTCPVIRSLITHPAFVQITSNSLSRCIDRLPNLAPDPRLYADVESALICHPAFPSLKGRGIGLTMQTLIKHPLFPQLERFFETLLNHPNFLFVEPSSLSSLLILCARKKKELAINRITQHPSFIKGQLCQDLAHERGDELLILFPFLEGASRKGLSDLVFQYAMYPYQRKKALQLLISYHWFPVESIIEVFAKAGRQGIEVPRESQEILNQRLGCCTVL